MEERRPSSLRPSGTIKQTLSGTSTPRGSPSFRRLHSSRTPRRGDGRGERFQWFRSNRLLFWLLLITLWAYLGFYVQSKWAHADNNDGKNDLIGYRSKPSTTTGNASTDQNSQPALAKNEKFVVANQNSTDGGSKNESKVTDASLAPKTSGTLVHKNSPRNPRKVKRTALSRRLRSKNRKKEKIADEGENTNLVEQEEEIPKRNTSYGLLVGPFGTTEDKILEWSAEKRSGTCNRNGEFARIVWSRKFVLVFHELSMTGAPLSMMELATELLSCGATVSAVVLSRRGGLMGELNRRRIKVVEDKAALSYKTSMKADLVIAGSAICSGWIEKYLEHNKAGSNQIAWWIMENRREYFDRAKPMLNRVKLLIYLSETQSKQWSAWCEEEGIKLNSPPVLMPLSVNDELAFVAGIPCSLNTPSFSVETMLERRRALRDAVRKEMGLTDKDMLVISLSSINPGKGQLFLLESARLTIDGENAIVREGNVSDNQRSRVLFQNLHLRESPGELSSGNQEKKELTLKVLIGSVGSKSNKVPYVKGLLRFLSQHPLLSKLFLWTPSTTRVASLYSAADAYVINAQGVGETFGRVTIEAMAFGLPVLGTEAGGTLEIVEHNITGLLHPVGRPGTKVLADNLLYLLNNPSKREKMGMRGKSKVERMYLKTQMYEKFAFVLFKCMRLK
ncbi:hypothetical protein MKX01_000226 [Papaver californicum]|nr:hypothetical protein MKX01_000226 [Papaver californicum]